MNVRTLKYNIPMLTTTKPWYLENVTLTWNPKIDRIQTLYSSKTVPKWFWKGFWTFQILDSMKEIWVFFNNCQMFHFLNIKSWASMFVLDPKTMYKSQTTLQDQPHCIICSSNSKYSAFYSTLKLTSHLPNIKVLL